MEPKQNLSLLILKCSLLGSISSAAAQAGAAAEKIADRTKSRQAAARTGRRKGKGQGGERTLVLLLPTCTKVLGSWG